MQHQNRNSPSLYEKLKFPELQRGSLEKQRKFWKKIINKHKINCIFTGEVLTNDNFDVDHFICWNFSSRPRMEFNLMLSRLINQKITKFLIKNFSSSLLILK